MPVLIVILGNVLIHIFTKPLTWFVIVSFFFVYRFSVTRMLDQARDTVLSYWPIAVFFAGVYLIRVFLKYYFEYKAKVKINER